MCITSISVWYHNHEKMWLICMSYYSKHTYSEKSKQYHLPSCMSTISTARMQQHNQTLNLLLCRPHPSMQVNSRCSNSPLQWQWIATFEQSENIESITRLWQRTDLISRFAWGLVACGLLSRSLETCGALSRSFENVSLWPPLFVHMAL